MAILLLRIAAWAAAMVLVLMVLGGVYLEISKQQALDDARSYSARAEALPLAHGRDGLAQLTAGGQRFRLRLAGFTANPAGPVVIMLHGFPATSAMWKPPF